MATDTMMLQGEVNEDPEEQQDVERLLAGFLRALLAEQQIPAAAPEKSE